MFQPDKHDAIATDWYMNSSTQ
ncbi:unnamed protein product, partial [Rotaria sordida]